MLRVCAGARAAADHDMRIRGQRHYEAKITWWRYPRRDICHFTWTYKSWMLNAFSTGDHSIYIIRNATFRSVYCCSKRSLDATTLPMDQWEYTGGQRPTIGTTVGSPVTGLMFDGWMESHAYSGTFTSLSWNFGGTREDEVRVCECDR